VTVIVTFASEVVQLQAEAMRRGRGLSVDDHAIRVLKRAFFQSVREQVLEDLRRHRVRLLQSFEHLPLAVVEVQGSGALDALLSHAGVRRVAEPEPLALQGAQSLPMIDPGELRFDSRYDGTGQTVVVLDSGIDWEASTAFGSCASGPGSSGCRVKEALEPFRPNPLEVGWRPAGQTGGHGTAVSAIVATVAPGAHLISMQVIGSTVDMTAAVLGAIDHSIANRDADNIVALNMSFGSLERTEEACVSPYYDALREARQNGIMPIVASGNGGFSQGTNHCSPDAVIVGAVIDEAIVRNYEFPELNFQCSGAAHPDGTPPPNPYGQVACFSNSSPGVDLLAPGATWNLAGGLGGYGTSFAAPVVSGLWAAMREAKPQLTLDQTLTHLKQTGTPITDPRNGVVRSRVTFSAVDLPYALIAGDTSTFDLAGWAVAVGDFNNNGLDDVAVGAPYDTVGGHTYAGSVNVIYGSPKGLSTLRNQLWSQVDSRIPSNPNAFERFGNTLAVADFNLDGYDDLAIGAPADINEANGRRAGSVTIIFGSSGGLRAGVYARSRSGAPTAGGPPQFWHQDVVGVEGVTENSDEFGGSLAVGDFDDDGWPDLAVGVPGEAIGAGSAEGMVNILFRLGAARALRFHQAWHRDKPGIVDYPFSGDRFAQALAAGDFDDDGVDDLAVGVPWDDHTDIEAQDAGMVHVLFGVREIGLSSSRSTTLHRGKASVEGDLSPNTRFGFSLAAADLDGDRVADLAVGVPGDANGTGGVNVFYGRERQILDGTRDEFVPAPSPGDGSFGHRLAVGDFDGGGGAPQLVVGAPSSRVEVDSAGRVHTFAFRVSSLQHQIPRWERGSLFPASLEGEAGSDYLGFALATGDLDGNGAADLVMGSPYRTINGARYTGAVNVVYGYPGEGLNSENDEEWHQDR
jgi:hypothetical protein